MTTKQTNVSEDVRMKELIARGRKIFQAKRDKDGENPSWLRMIESFLSRDGMKNNIEVDVETGEYVSKDPVFSKICHILNVVEGAPITSIAEIIFSLSDPHAHATTVHAELWKLFEIILPTTAIVKSLNLVVEVAPIAVKLFADAFERPVLQNWERTSEGFLKKYLGLDFDLPDWVLDLVAFVISILIALFGTVFTFANGALSKIINNFGNTCRDFNNIRNLFTHSSATFSTFASDLIGTIVGKQFITEEDAAYNALMKRLEDLNIKIREQVNSLLQDPTSLAEGENVIASANATIKECDEIRIALAKTKKNTLNARPILDSINDRMKSLLQIVADVRAVVHAQCRPEPTVTWFTGDPGVGKSHVLLKFRKELSRLANEGKPLRNITLNTTEEHQTGLNAQIDIVTFDDFGQAAEDHDHEILFQLVSVEPFRTKQAALEAKGILAAPKFVVAASNEDYIMSSCKIKNLPALNGRRQCVYKMENDFIEQWQKKNAGNESRPLQGMFLNPDGTPSEFAKQKMSHDRFYKIPSLNNDLKQAKGLPEPRPVPVSFEQIVEDAVRRQKLSEIAWKQRVSSFLEENLGPGSVKERLDNLRRSNSAETVSTVSTEPELQGRAKIVQSPRIKTVLLEGMPGTGKTHLVAEALSYMKEFQQVRLHDFCNGTPLKGAVLIDDITIGSVTDFDKIVSAVHDFYDGALPDVTTLVVTANPGLYSEVCPNSEKLELFKRRCDVYSFGFRHVPWAGIKSAKRYTSKDLEKENVRYEKVVKITFGDTEVTRQQVIERILVRNEDPTRSYRWIETPVFSVMNPTYIIEVDRTFDEIMYMDATASQIMALIVKELKVVKGTYVKTYQYLDAIKENLKACNIPPDSLRGHSNYDSFVMQFNNQRIKMYTDDSCVIHFNDISLGAVVDVDDVLTFGRHVCEASELENSNLWDAPTRNMYDRLSLRANYIKLADTTEVIQQEVQQLVEESTNALQPQVLTPNIFKTCAVFGFKIVSMIGKIVSIIGVANRHNELVTRRDKTLAVNYVAEAVTEFCEEMQSERQLDGLDKTTQLATVVMDACDTIHHLTLQKQSPTERLALQNTDNMAAVDKLKNTIEQQKYNYDKDGNRILKKAVRRQNAEVPEVQKYNYDKDGNRILKKAVRRQGDLQKYNYDKDGNRILKKAVRRQMNKPDSDTESEDENHVQYMITEARKRMEKKLKTYQDIDPETESDTEKKSNRATPNDLKTWNEFMRDKGLPVSFIPLASRDCLQYQEIVNHMSKLTLEERPGRHVGYYGGAPYTYGGKTHQPQEIPSFGKDMMEMVNGYGFQANSMLINLYDGGKRSRGKRNQAGIPAHCDDEPCLDQTQPIVMVNVGEQRELTLCHKKSRKVYKIPLYNNAIFVMEPALQREYTHAIEYYRADIKHPRISFTFRKMNDPKLEIADLPTLYKTGSPNQKVLNNQAYLVQRSDDGTGKDHCLSHVIFLTDTWGIGNKHCFEHAPTDQTYIQYNNTEYTYKWLPVYDDQTKDVGVFILTGKQRPPCSNIIKYVGSAYDRSPLQGLTSVIQVGCKEASVARNVTLRQHVTMTFSSANGTSSSSLNLIEGQGVLQDISTVCRVTKKGDCGSPWMLDCLYHEKPLIAIHSAGDRGGRVYGAVLLIEHILKAKERLEQPVELQMRTEQGVLLIEADGIMPVDAEHVEDAAILSEVCDVIGQTTQKLPNPNKTKFTRSPFHVEDSTIEDLIGDQYSPAVFSMNDPRIHPDYDGHVKYDAQLKWVFGQPENNVTREEIIECIEELADYAIAEMCKNNCTTGIEKITTTKAINGLDKERFPHSNPINRRSSPGYPYITQGYTSKMKFLEFDECAQIWTLNKQDGRAVTNNIAHLTDCCRKGRKAGVVFMSCQKDEAVKDKKVWGNPPKTRSFAAGPLHLNLLWRKYFLTAEQNCNNISGTSFFTGGLDPGSEGWHAMVTSMLEVGTHGFDEDTPSYDAHMMNEFLEEQWRFYDKIYQRFDPKWTPDDAKVRKGIYMQMANPLITLNDLIVKMSGHVSGKPATRTDNDVYNAVLKLMCWKEFARRVHADEICLTDKQKHSIQPTWASYCKHVCSKFGGDDHVCTVVKWLTPYWNFATFKKLMMEVWGVEITDAQKSSEDYTVRPLAELEFLKRYSYINNGFWRGRLHIESFDKLMNWTRCRKQRYPYEAEFGPIILPDEMESEVDAIMREAVLYGPDFYERIYNHMRERLEEFGINIALKTWNEYNTELYVPLSREGFRV